MNQKRNKNFHTCSVIICALLVLMFTSIGANSAFAQNGEDVLVTENDTEFSMEVAKLTSDNLEDAEDLSDSVKRRLLAVCSQQPDFSNCDGLVDVVSDGDGLYVIQFDSEENAEKAYNRLSDSEYVQSIEFDEVVSTAALPKGASGMNGKHLSWGADTVGADEYAAKVNESKKNPLTIAVIDSGVDEDHEFIKHKLLKGYDFVDRDDKADDEDGHGTHVTGIITDCTMDVEEISILPVRVMDEKGYGSRAEIAAGVLYAADNGASVLNMSLGGSHSAYLDAAIRKAINKGAIVVAASGNEGLNIDYRRICPAHIKEVVSVGAINRRLWVEPYSNYGESLDVVAPGSDIYSSVLNNSYEAYSGTSMAAPHVTACIALMEMRYGRLSVSQVDSLIKRSCDVYRDKMRYGNGVINLRNLIADIASQNTSVSRNTFTYTGKAIKPGVSVKRNNEALFNGTDYSAAYSNNVNVGKGMIVITGKGSYYGKKAIYFNIIPQGTSVSKIKQARKKISLKWKKQARQTDGYQVQYALNKKFKSAKTKTIKNTKKTSVTLKKLKARKKYYVRIRTYKKVSGQTYYSNWSKVKTVKTK